jgi:hypothetical protein
MGCRAEDKLKLTDAEIQRAFVGDWAQEFPPVLSVAQAAKLAQVPVKTVYDWSSRGLLSQCAVRKGKYLRVFRDRFIRFLFETTE